ncbi:DUF998 domain-containing protein [Streptomyces sp. NPDC051018]|uniref:DUF998 domain-containing protein n=1 Tax=Streptomyces sp. NPDC051018 TaxID=3365639 RepID=UPI00379FB6E2
MSATTTTLSASPATASTRRLLLAAAVSAPLWAVVSLAQAATREGFDLTRHPLSMLSNGSLGWLQITNFVIAGLLTAVGSFGLRRALYGTPGGTWVPRLALVNGIGMFAAGIFVMDAGDGFAGAPAGTPETISGMAMGHLLAGSISFIALIAANFVLGRHFSRAGERGLAIGSRIAGAALLVGNGWATAGGKAGSLTLAIGAITAMLWLSGVALLKLRGTAAAGHGRR